jgi:hypothetical protein
MFSALQFQLIGLAYKVIIINILVESFLTLELKQFPNNCINEDRKFSQDDRFYLQSDLAGQIIVRFQVEQIYIATLEKLKLRRL